jgi:hypothetical protein
VPLLRTALALAVAVLAFPSAGLAQQRAPAAGVALVHPGFPAQFPQPGFPAQFPQPGFPAQFPQPGFPALPPVGAHPPRPPLRPRPPVRPGFGQPGVYPIYVGGGYPTDQYSYPQYFEHQPPGRPAHKPTPRPKDAPDVFETHSTSNE